MAAVEATTNPNILLELITAELMKDMLDEGADGSTNRRSAKS